MTEIQRNLILGVLVVLVGAGALYYFTRQPVSAPGPMATTTSEAATTTSVSAGVGGTGDYTVSLVGATPPKLGTITISSKDLPEEAKPILRQKIEAQYEVLRKEPTRVDVWLLLGTNRKIAGDYEGAIEAWEYVAATAPTSMVATARGNLGDLYMYFLKDYSKAKTNLTMAIKANGAVIEYYRALFYLEKDINKDPAAARAVVELGLKNNPDHPDLKYLQSLL